MNNGQYNVTYKEYKGMQLLWDAEGVMDQSFGSQYEELQGKREYREWEDIVSDERLVQLFHTIIREAIEYSATDIQVVPKSDRSLVKFRLDDRMETVREIHRGAHDGLMVVLQYNAGKALGNFAEASIDGHIQYNLMGTHYDFRMAMSPSQFGPMVDLRLLSSDTLDGDLTGLGLPERIVHTYRRITRQKEGLILLVGGTGSGKSTTLATGIMEVNRTFRYKLNILTIENPVEYIIEDIVQHSVNELSGYTFVKALQTMLRQNPDQILVGEVNDNETAAVMARAAGTGHLVYSTLHANSVLEVHDALRAYGLSERDIMQTLRLVVYQSLEPRLCEQCKIRKVVSPEEKNWLDRYLLTNEEIGLVYSPNIDGCDHCDRGYQGRVILGEMLESNREYRILFEELQRQDLGQDELKRRLLATEGINFYPIEYDVFRRLREGSIGLDTAYKLIAG